MDNIKLLLKFGKKKHLKDLVEGKLYCSNAITFWGIEDKLKIKGQGDILEAGTRIFAKNMTMKHLEANEIVDLGNTNVILRVEPAEKMPVFCMFAVYNDDCMTNDDGKVVINLSEEKKQTIREHFPNADAVVVISTPDIFIKDIEKSIGVDIKSGSVQYFKIDKGFSTKDAQTSNDMEYMMYLMQDTLPSVKENGSTHYSFKVKYAYRALFCKDVFFDKEQEYRIVLPNEKIDKGESYPIKLSKKYEIFDLEEFFK